MSLFCRHNYRAKAVLYGENLLGDGMYAVAFYCTKCGRRRLDKGYGSEESAERWLKWYQENQS